MNNNRIYDKSTRVIRLWPLFLAAIVCMALFSTYILTRDKGWQDAAGQEGIVWWTPNRYSHIDNMGQSEVYGQAILHTGVPIEFYHPQKGEYRERFLTMIRQESLPHIISHDFVTDYPGGIDQALDDGVIMSLNQVIDDWCPNLKRVLDENPTILDEITTSEGQIFCFPSLQIDEEIRTYIGPYIRKDIFDAYDIEVPVTVDEWYEVLCELKEKTGSPPLSFYGGKIMDTDFLISAYGIKWGFYVQEDQVKLGIMEPEFETFASEFKKWYQEGLISPGVFTDSNKVYQTKVVDGQASILVDYISSMETYLSEMDEGVEFQGITYPVGRKGDLPFSVHQTQVLVPYASAYVSSDNPDLEATARFFDYLYSDEGQVLMNFGLEGNLYDMVDGLPVYRREAFADQGQLLGQIKKVTVPGPYIRMLSQFNQMCSSENQQEALRLWRIYDEDAWSSLNLKQMDPSINYGGILDSMDEVVLEWMKDYCHDEKNQVSVDDLIISLEQIGVKEVLSWSYTY